MPDEPARDGTTPPAPPGGWAGQQQPGYGAPPPAYGQSQQPGYGAPPPGYGQSQQPGYGAPPPGYGQSQYAAGQGPSTPGGYRPAPVQRGIIPLRPLSLGELLDGAFRSIRAKPRVMFGVSAVVVTVAVLIDTLTQFLGFGFLGDTLDAPVSADMDVLLSDTLGAGGSSLVSNLISTVATTILTGLLIISVSRSVIGQKVSLAEAWQRARPRILPLLGLTFLLVFIFVAVAVVLVGAVVLLILTEQVIAAVSVGLLAVLLFIAFAAWFGTRVLLSTPALVLEEQGVVASLKRGWSLSRGSFWRLLGIYLLAQVIAFFVALIVVGPASLIVVMLGLNPYSNPVALAITALASILALLITTPFVAAVVALLYIDLRIRREGLDIELGRAAENAAADGEHGGVRT